MEPYEGYIRLILSEKAASKKDEVSAVIQDLTRDYKRKIEEIMDNCDPRKSKEVPVEMKIILKEERPIARPPARKKKSKSRNR